MTCIGHAQAGHARVQQLSCSVTRSPAPAGSCHSCWRPDASILPRAYPGAHNRAARHQFCQHPSSPSCSCSRCTDTARSRGVTTARTCAGCSGPGGRCSGCCRQHPARIPAQICFTLCQTSQRPSIWEISSCYTLGQVSQCFTLNQASQHSTLTQISSCDPFCQVSWCFNPHPSSQCLTPNKSSQRFTVGHSSGRLRLSTIWCIPKGYSSGRSCLVWLT